MRNKDPVDQALRSISYTMSDFDRREWKGWNQFFKLGCREANIQDEPDEWSTEFEKFDKEMKRIRLHEFLRIHLSAFYELDTGLAMKIQLCMENWLKHIRMKPLYWDAEK
jgi:hypothetical protein